MTDTTLPWTDGQALRETFAWDSICPDTSASPRSRTSGADERTVLSVVVQWVCERISNSRGQVAPNEPPSILP